MTIGERIAEERKKKGMTQEDMAEKLNLSRQAISKWESGSSFPDTENLLKLSLLFSVSVDYLLKGEMVEEKNKEEEVAFDRYLVKQMERQYLGIKEEKKKSR